MIPFSARGKRDWWENRWNWYVREYYQCSKCQQDEVLWPFRAEGEKNTKINPKMQTNNHSNVTNVKPVSDDTFVVMDDNPTWLRWKKDSGVTKVFPPLLYPDPVDSDPSKLSFLLGLIVGDMVRSVVYLDDKLEVEVIQSPLSAFCQHLFF